MTRRPRFNGNPDDHAPTQQWLSHLRTDDVDGTTVTWPPEPGTAQFAGASGLGVMPGGVMVIEVAGPAPLAGYQPAPASFPALPPAIEPRPEPGHVLAPVPVTEPAKFGDAIHLPVIWCEMPGCIGWFHDPASAGFADARDRAAAAGWRTDGLGRLACPECQQGRSDYRTPQPVAWHHPEVARRWHARQPLSDTGAFRLGVQAEVGRRISREDPALARAIAGATRRTAAS